MTIKQEDQIQYLLQIQDQILQNIKFADQKALVFIVINTALLGAVYHSEALAYSGLLLPLLGLLALMLLSSAVLCQVCVVHPRFRGRATRRGGKGFADQSRIVLWESTEEEYKSQFAALDYVQLRDELALFILDQARRDEAKYLWLRWSIWLSLVGWGVASLFFLGATPIG